MFHAKKVTKLFFHLLENIVNHLLGKFILSKDRVLTFNRAVIVVYSEVFSLLMND